MGGFVAVASTSFLRGTKRGLHTRRPHNAVYGYVCHSERPIHALTLESSTPNSRSSMSATSTSVLASARPRIILEARNDLGQTCSPSARYTTTLPGYSGSMTGRRRAHGYVDELCCLCALAKTSPVLGITGPTGSVRVLGGRPRSVQPSPH